jgi:hypothetical protein
VTARWLGRRISIQRILKEHTVSATKYTQEHATAQDKNQHNTSNNKRQQTNLRLAQQSLRALALALGLASRCRTVRVRFRPTVAVVIVLQCIDGEANNKNKSNDNQIMTEQKRKMYKLQSNTKKQSKTTKTNLVVVSRATIHALAISLGLQQKWTK